RRQILATQSRAGDDDLFLAALARARSCRVGSGRRRSGDRCGWSLLGRSRLRDRRPWKGEGRQGDEPEDVILPLHVQLLLWLCCFSGVKQGKPVFSSTALRQRRLERCAILRVACPISAARLHDRLSIVKPGTREVSPRGTPRADTRALGGIGPWAGHRHLCRAAGAARTGPVQFVLRCAIGAILERRAPRALKTF